MRARRARRPGGDPAEGGGQLGHARREPTIEQAERRTAATCPAPTLSGGSEDWLVRRRSPEASPAAAESCSMGQWRYLRTSQGKMGQHLLHIGQSDQACRMLDLVVAGMQLGRVGQPTMPEGFPEAGLERPTIAL